MFELLNLTAPTIPTVDQLHQQPTTLEREGNSSVCVWPFFPQDPGSKCLTNFLCLHLDASDASPEFHVHQTPKNKIAKKVPNQAGDDEVIFIGGPMIRDDPNQGFALESTDTQHKKYRQRCTP